MDKYKIKIINKSSIEVPKSLNKLNLTYEMWSSMITPWERRRIFRDFKLLYSIGNGEKDMMINYNKINEVLKIHQLLNKAKNRLLVGKIINKKEYEICEDIIYKLLEKIDNSKSWIG